MVFIFLAYFTLYNGLQFHPSQQSNRQRINLKNIQAAPAAQFQKNK